MRLLRACFQKIAGLSTVKLGHRSIKRGLPLSLVVAACLDKTSIDWKSNQVKERLTHEFLIKQASGVVGNAVSQLLVQIMVAILDTSENYRKTLKDAMSQMEDSSRFPGFYSDINDLIIASRSLMDSQKKELLDLYSLLEYVEKTVGGAAETCFLAGADSLSITLSESLHAAQVQVAKIRDELAALEKEYLNLYQSSIDSVKKPPDGI